MARLQKFILGIGLGLLALYLASQHRSHLLLWMPWVLLGACFAMHLFMHDGHGEAASKEHEH